MIYSLSMSWRSIGQAFTPTHLPIDLQIYTGAHEGIRNFRWPHVIQFFLN